MTVMKKGQEIFFDSFKREIPQTSFKKTSLSQFHGIKGYTLDYNDTMHQLESRRNKLDQIMPYFKRISNDFTRVELDDFILSGMPAIKNTRIPVHLIVACLRDGMTIDEIKDDYNLSNADIMEALEFTIAILTKPYMDESD